MVQNIRHSKDSNCSRALHFRNNQARNLSSLAFPRFNISRQLKPSRYKLKAMNVGLGTTGTRSINTLVCNSFEVQTVHFTSFCPYIKTEKYLQAFIAELKHCLISGSVSARCLSWKFIILYEKVLKEVMTTFDFASDYPIAEMFPDILHYVPDLTVMFSLRDPKAWSESRMRAHPAAPICRPHLWDHPSVLHPFDIAGCVYSSKYVTNAVMRIQHLTSNHQLADAYIRYNKFIFEFTAHKKVPVLSLCVWDSSLTRPEDLERMIREFWATRPPTKSWSNRHMKKAYVVRPQDIVPIEEEVKNVMSSIDEAGWLPLLDDGDIIRPSSFAKVNSSYDHRVLTGIERDFSGVDYRQRLQESGTHLAFTASLLFFIFIAFYFACRLKPF